MDILKSLRADENAETMEVTKVATISYIYPNQKLFQWSENIKNLESNVATLSSESDVASFTLNELSRDAAAISSSILSLQS
jgi:cell division protein FtsL